MTETGIRTAALPGRHALATRLLHTGLALAVTWQLGTSLIMEGPRGARPGDVFFTTHSYVGLAAMASIVLFWANPALRRAGTFETVHELFANLARAYPIGHAGLAVLHHLRGEAPLSEMWSPGGRNRGDTSWT